MKTTESPINRGVRRRRESKILVVDDSAAIRKILRHGGHRFRIAPVAAVLPGNGDRPAHSAGVVPRLRQPAERYLRDDGQGGGGWRTIARRRALHRNGRRRRGGGSEEHTSELQSLR